MLTFMRFFHNNLVDAEKPINRVGQLVKQQIIMKKNTLLIIVFMVLGFAQQVNACSLPSLSDAIDGPTSVCSGGSEFYTVDFASVQCVQSLDFSVLVEVDGQVFQQFNSVSGAFNVNWPVNSTGSNRSGRVSVAYLAADGACDAFGLPQSVVTQRVLSLDVEIRPATLPPSTPTITSRVIGTNTAQFTASSARATSYSWTVSGGTIVGNATGSVLRVRPNDGACSVTATARGRLARCEGGFAVSGARSNTMNISRPTIFGPTSFDVPSDRFFTEFSIEISPAATSYTYTLDNNTNFNFTDTPSRTFTTSFPQISLQCNGTSGLPGFMTVVASNSCGVSNTETIQLNCVSGGGGFLLTENAPINIFPNTISAGETLNVENLPSDVVSVEMLPLTGRISADKTSVELSDNSTLKVNTAKLARGLHVMRFTYKDGHVEQRNILVK